MTNPFMDLRHCARVAIRHAFRTGDVYHVIATGSDVMPLAVIDEHQLFDLSDQIDLADLLFSADPFGDLIAR